MRTTQQPDAHNTPDLTPEGVDAAARGADVRRLTAGYDTGDQRQASPPPADPPLRDPDDTADEAPLDTDSGLDFGAFGGRDVGSDIGGDIASGTE